MSAEMFSRHLEALSANLYSPPILLGETEPTDNSGKGWALTFDDGGIGALIAAEMLETRNWKGHFFLTTDHINQRSFLSRNQILELRDRGHVIGSHSRSHPKRMADLSFDGILDEWRGSVMALEDVLGQPVSIASVPGGYYRERIAVAAAEAGISILFNSEPTSKSYVIGKCTVLGRFGIKSTTSAVRAVGFATGNMVHCGLQRLAWDSKKMARRFGGTKYEALRSLFVD
jgi:peptidoglycan/xylan/chitin deacetylase (PgdA/CDA1 family)